MFGLFVPGPDTAPYFTSQLMAPFVVTCRAPLDGVDLLLMSLQVVNTAVAVHGPHLECHVVTAAGKEFPLRIPLDRVHLVGVTLEGLDGPILVQLADVDLLVYAAGGETLLGLPVDIERGRGVEGELLLAVPGGRVPDYGRPVHARTQNKVPRLIPLEREDRTLVLTESLLQLACGGPDPGVAVITAGGQQVAVTIPVQRGHVLVAWNLLPLHLDAVLQHLHRGLPALGEVPDPGGRVSTAAGQQVLLGVPGADEHLAVVTLQHCRLLRLYLDGGVHLHGVCPAPRPCPLHRAGGTGGVQARTRLCFDGALDKLQQ